MSSGGQQTGVRLQKMSEVDISRDGIETFAVNSGHRDSQEKNVRTSRFPVQSLHEQYYPTEKSRSRSLSANTRGGKGGRKSPMPLRNRSNSQNSTHKDHGRSTETKK